MKKFYQWLQAKNKSKGSSLIELLVVLSIIAILISITIPSIIFLKQHALSSEIDRLQIICQYLQKKAINNSKKEYLNFNLKEHTYFYNNQTQKLTNGIYFGIISNINGPPAQPVASIITPITFPKQRITFYPNGSISAGTVYLINQDQRSLYALTIPVAKISFIRKYKLHAGTWLYLK